MTQVPVDELNPTNFLEELWQKEEYRCPDILPAKNFGM